MIDTNPAERWLTARKALNGARIRAQAGPLFAHPEAQTIADAERRMGQAEVRMQREGGTYDLWATGWTVGPMEGK